MSGGTKHINGNPDIYLDVEKREYKETDDYEYCETGELDLEYVNELIENCWKNLNILNNIKEELE